MALAQGRNSRSNINNPRQKQTNNSEVQNMIQNNINVNPVHIVNPNEESQKALQSNWQFPILPEWP